MIEKNINGSINIDGGIYNSIQANIFDGNGDGIGSELYSSCMLDSVVNQDTNYRGGSHYIHIGKILYMDI